MSWPLRANSRPFGNEVLVDDRARHVPIRIEIDLVNLAGDLRGRTLGLADDSRMPRDDLAAGNRLDLRRRDIDDDIAAGGVGRDALQPLQTGLELREPEIGRHVQGRDRGLAVDDAGRGEAMARLKLLHGDDDGGVVFARDALAKEVAGDLKPPLQDFDLLPALAGPHHFCRDCRPTALGHDRLVSPDGGLGRLDVARGKRGQSQAPDW